MAVRTDGSARLAVPNRVVKSVRGKSLRKGPGDRILPRKSCIHHRRSHDMFADLSPWLICVAIFGARILDVSLGTVRTILVFRGYRFRAATIGFFEILIWLLAAGAVISHLDHWYYAIAYAAGFASGNVVGSWLESKLAMGHELARIVSVDPEKNLARALRERGSEVIEMAGKDGQGAVEILLLVETRRRMPRLLQFVRETDPSAIWTLTDIRRPDVTTPRLKRLFTPFDWTLPGKRK